MPRTFENLTLADAKRMLNTGEAKADELGIPYNIAGAIGASAGTVAQDIAVAAAAISALEPNIVDRPATVADQS